jgi:hypothetical protein
MSAGYNSPARLDVKGAWDFYLTASFIYWIAGASDYFVCEHRQFLPYGSTQHNDNFVEEMMDSHFGYHPGFKVGLGMNSDRDDWSLYAEYTWLRNSDTHTWTVNYVDPAEIEDNYLYIPLPENTVSGYDLDLVKNNRKYHYNMLDVELSRPYYVGTKLIFQPFVGVEGGWIKEKNHRKQRGGKSNRNGITYMNSETKSWLVGPRVGIDTSWLLGEGVRFFVNTALSVFYQDFDTDLKFFPVNVENEDIWTKKYEERAINAHIETALGFGWGTYFSNDEWHFDLSAGYEFHLLTDQYFLHDNGAGQYLTAKDHYLHGLTVTARFDF